MANLVDNSGDAASNLVTGTGTASATFPMPGNVALFVESVIATVDNTAGADTTAELIVRDSSGEVIATKRQGNVIPSGDTGTATFALQLVDEARRGPTALTWLHGIGFSQVGGGTSVAAGASSTTQFDGSWENNDETTFLTDDGGGPSPIGFLPQRDGMYGVWIASQWDVAAFDKMIGYQTPLIDGLFNGRNSNSLAVYAFFLLSGLSLFTTISCANKNNAAVPHNVTASYMSAVYLGET